MALAPQAFTWGSNGRKISSPEQAARQRLIAEALMASGMSPAQNIGQGLADVTGALTGSILNNEVSAAEEAGTLEASGLFQGLGSSSPEADIIAALSNPWASDAQSSVAQALLGQQFSQNDPMNQLQLAQAQLNYDQDLAGAAAGGTEFFGTPVPFQNPDGSISFGQLGKDGTFKPLDLPEGASPAPSTRTVDTPTETITMDIYGNIISRMPKDIRGKEREEAVGAAEGAAIAGAPGDIAAGETALDLLDQIKTHPELANATGFTSFANAIPGTPRYGFQNLVEQAKSGAFLTAIQEMRGLGSLSNAEGQTATAAVTRMNTALSKEDFLKAVDDYEKIIRRGVERAKSKMAPPVGSANPNAVVVDGFTIEAVD
jgi:hypothetical protein